MSANPHANGGLLLRELELPDFRDYAVDVPAPGTTTSEATRVLGGFLRDVMRANPDHFRLFGPDETASNRLGAVFEATDRAWEAERLRHRRSPRARRAGDGGAQRAPLPGLARGLPADRPPRAVQLLRGVHPHHRLDVQPARQVAEGDARRSPGGARSPRSTTCSPPTSGARTTTASPTRTPASSTTSSTRRRRSSASTCRPDANCLLSVADHCLRSPPLRQRDRRRQAARSSTSSTMDEAVVHCTRGVGHLGVGDQRRRRGARRRAGLRRRRADARDARRGGDPARAPAGAARPRRQRRRPDAPPARERAPARALRPRVRRALHDRPAGDLRLPRLPVADPPPHLPPRPTTTTSTCAATRRRARRRRRSTW